MNDGVIEFPKTDAERQAMLRQRAANRTAVAHQPTQIGPTDLATPEDYRMRDVRFGMPEVFMLWVVVAVAALIIIPVAILLLIGY